MHHNGVDPWPGPGSFEHWMEMEVMCRQPAGICPLLRCRGVVYNLQLKVIRGTVTARHEGAPWQADERNGDPLVSRSWWSFTWEGMQRRPSNHQPQWQREGRSGGRLNEAEDYVPAVPSEE